MSNTRLWVERVVLVAALLLAWEVSSGTVVPANFAGEPSAIARELGGWAASGELWTHLWVTVWEAAAGCAVGGVLGVVIGLVFGLYPFVARTVDPVFTAVYAVPKVSFAPMLIMMFGIYQASKVALTALIVFFFVFYDTFRGTRAVSTELKEMVQVMGATRWQFFRWVVWPTALEWVVDGLKVSVPYAFIGAVAGEIVISNKGLGFLIRQHANNLNVSGVFAAIAVLLVCSGLVNWLVNRARAGVSRWRGETIV